MTNAIIVHCLLIIFLALPGKARAGYAFNANCMEAYDAAWALNTGKANTYISLEQRDNPHNLVPVYLTSLSRFVNVFSTENKDEYKAFTDNKDKWLDALKEDDNGPWYSFCRAEIFLQSAVLKVKFADYISSAYDFNKAYHNLESCADEYPDFLPAKKDLLLMKALVGTVPDNYRRLLRVLGFSGELRPAMAQYEKLLVKMQDSREYYMFAHEARIIYAYLNYNLLNKPETAWREMETATRAWATNPVDAFVRANLAMRLKKNDIAIQALAPHVKSFPVIPYLDYLMGLAKLQRGDRNAGVYFGRYIKTYKGEHYIKDAYLKLGWTFFLAGDMKHYKSAMELVPVFGTAQIEEDKNALREAKASKYTVPEILRARLYFDGGYLQKAEAEIGKTDVNALEADIQKAEYHYRYARIEDGRGRDTLALQQYQAVIDAYSGLNTYFAPASCYFSGMMYERRHDYDKARQYYNKCLEYKGYIYKDSFDQKAYAGLKRLG